MDNSRGRPRRGPWSTLDLLPDTIHIRDLKQREKQVVRILDDIGFNWTVFIAISAGFLASFYTIFSTNIIGPALQYVYPPQDHGWKDPIFTMDMVTIGTTAIGMVVFGHLADRLGRKFLYGIELFIIIIGSIGMIQASNGFSASKTEHSLNIYGAATAWRTIQGLGIGAEYPLSAVIAAEFASTQTRGTLMASMFAMQSIGRVLAYAVAIGSIGRFLDNKDTVQDQSIAIDKIWRLVVGISAIPAILAIGLRLTIPETPRFYTGIERNLRKAVRAAEQVGGKAVEDDLRSIHSDIQPTRAAESDVSTAWATSAWSYLFGPAKAWRTLLGVSVLWFLLDVAFYGLGLDSPATLDRLWMNTPAVTENCTFAEYADPAYTVSTYTLEGGITTTITELLITPTPTSTEASEMPSRVVTATSAVSKNPSWNDDEGDRCATIAKTLYNNAARNLQLSAVGSLLGSLATIVLVNYVPRRRLMCVTSGVLAILFIAAGVAVNLAAEGRYHNAGMVFFALTQFVFNLGPNTLTFIVAAESFPTVFRGTFYGTAAAWGKVGALVIRTVTHSAGDGKRQLWGFMFAYSGVMVVLAGLSLLPGWILDIQHPKAPGLTSLEKKERGWRAWIPSPLRNRTLEEIAPYPEEVPVQQEAHDEENGLGVFKQNTTEAPVSDPEPKPGLETYA